MSMSYIQYLSTRRKLLRGIRDMVDRALSGVRRGDVRPIIHTDVEREEHYAFFLYAQGWGLRVRNKNHWVVLDIARSGRRVSLGGVRSKSGRVAHLETVSVEHTLKMVAEVLKRLPTNE